jgi:uncharacterized membrane protein YdjX (TVP38/TMEM64 family)
VNPELKVQSLALMAAGTKTIDENQPSVLEPDPGEIEPRPSWGKIIILAACVGVLLTVAYVSPLRNYLSQWREVSAQIRSFGTLAPLVLTVSVAVLVGVGFPRLAFCIIAGMALGFWKGLLWAQLGTLLGNYAIFILVRTWGRDWAQRFLVKRARLHSLTQKRGTLGVFLVRQLPLPGLVINLACALLPIRHWDFLLGTIFGQLPQAIPCTLIGAGFIQSSFTRSIEVTGLAVIASIVVGLGLRYALRQSR